MTHFISVVLESTSQFQFENSLYKIQIAKFFIFHLLRFIKHRVDDAILASTGIKVAVEYILITYHFFIDTSINLNIWIIIC